MLNALSLTENKSRFLAGIFVDGDLVFIVVAALVVVYGNVVVVVAVVVAVVNNNNSRVVFALGHTMELPATLALMTSHAHTLTYTISQTHKRNRVHNVRRAQSTRIDFNRFLSLVFYDICVNGNIRYHL